MLVLLVVCCTCSIKVKVGLIPGGGSQGALPPPPLYETLVMYVYPFGVLTYACIPSCE